MNATEIADSIQDLIFRHLPVSMFMNNFLPSLRSNQKRPPSKSTTVFSFEERDTGNPSSIDDVQSDLISAISQHGLCPGFNFILTDCAGLCDKRIACYPQGIDVADAAAAWAALEFTIKIRETDIMKDKDAMREETLFVFSQLTRQHRTFVFTVNICGAEARFLLWDRSGVAVTSRIQYTRDPHWLTLFLWRYSYLARRPDARGFDNTATLATAAESGLLTTGMKHYLAMVKANKLGLIENAQNTMDKTYPAYKIRLSNDSEVVIRRPIYTKYSVAGTATRGYLGYSIQGKRLVFLKDLWDNERNKFQLTEREVYQRLIPCHSPHIPKSLLVEPVFNSKGKSQMTRSPALACSVWLLREHCRVVQEVYYPISELLSSKDVVCVMRDCLLALHEAYLKAKIMHSDVSTGNIMMTSECAGILNDWGNSFEAGIKQRFRSGTWAFMSCEKARDRDLQYHPSIKDDIESMFWVLYCQMLQSFVTEITELQWHWKMFTEREVLVIDGRQTGVGGTLKYEFLTSQRRADQFRDSVTMTSPALKDLIFQFRNLLGRYYTSCEKLKSQEFCQLPADKQQEHQRNVDALKDARAVIQLFNEALMQDGWVCGDAYERKIWREKKSHVAFVSSFGVPAGADIYDVLYSMPDSDSVTGDKTIEPSEGTFPQIHTGKHPRSDHPKVRNGSEAGSQSSVEEPLPKKAKQG